MEMPQIGQNQNEFQQYYQQPNTDGSKKKLVLIIGGVLVLIIVLILLLTSGGTKGGQNEMKLSLQATTDALGIIDEYESELTYAPTKNDIALSQILIRGNFQKLNALYNTTYKPKKKFSATPKVDPTSKTSLDTSARNNTLDSDIITALKPKIISAKKNLTLAKSSFTKKDSLEKINVSIADLTSIENILDRPR